MEGNVYKQIYGFGYDSGFLFKDRQLGQNVYVNGKNVYDNFNADLISLESVSPSIEKDIYKSLGKHTYKINIFKTGNSGIEMKFYVGGHTHQEAQININQLLYLFSNQTVIITFDETDFEYACVLESFTNEYTGVEFYYLLTLVVNATKRLPIIKKEYAASVFNTSEQVTIDFDNVGTIISGMDIIMQVSGTTSFSLSYKRENGKTHTVHFNDISSSNYYYKIGGLDGVIYRSGNLQFNTYTNVFENTDLMDFPVAFPGANSIIFNNGATNSSIKKLIINYYPTFLI